MADYSLGTGSGGRLLIRDLGADIQFFVQAGSGATFVGSLAWSYSANGQNIGGSVTYPGGAPLLHVASTRVTTDQTIRFSIGRTGTTGLGGPTDFYLTIRRASVPPAPSSTGFPFVGHNTATFTFRHNGDGGGAILEYQVHYGTDPSTGQYSVNGNNGTVYLNNLGLGNNYYVWVRARNVAGWGPWSVRDSFMTYAGGKYFKSGIWRRARFHVKYAGKWRQAIPFVKKNGRWEDAG